MHDIERATAQVCSYGTASELDQYFFTDRKRQPSSMWKKNASGNMESKLARLREKFCPD